MTDELNQILRLRILSDGSNVGSAMTSHIAQVNVPVADEPLFLFWLFSNSVVLNCATSRPSWRIFLQDVQFSAAVSKRVWINSVRFGEM